MLHRRLRSRPMRPFAATPFLTLATLTILAAMPALAEPPAAPPTPASAEKTFAQDVAFLKAHKETIELVSADGQSRIAVVPAYQGRVLTSTARGPDGTSYGFIHYPYVEAGKLVPHINIPGGEDRFWMGPEGGQFAIFFKKGDKFTLDDWQTPAPIDSDAYAVASKTDTSVTFRHDCSVSNFSGAKFNVRIDRTVRLVDRAAAAELLHADLGKTACVAYESENTITNTGEAAWTKDTGLLSIWVLGMYKPSPRATVVIPFRPGTEEDFGPVVNDKYFGAISADRLVVRQNVLFFKADGQSRGKIGITPRRARPVMGAYDADRNVLTLVTYTLPPNATDYVNSMWEQQKDPYAGDAANSYNDGPSTPGGKPFGPFFELETSSPAAALAPSASMTHTHRTIHLEGPREDLDRIAKATLNVGLDDIEKVFAH
jgi:hypothetical protein